MATWKHSNPWLSPALQAQTPPPAQSLSRAAAAASGIRRHRACSTRSSSLRCTCELSQFVAINCRSFVGRAILRAASATPGRNTHITRSIQPDQSTNTHAHKLLWSGFADAAKHHNSPWQIQFDCKKRNHDWLPIDHFGALLWGARLCNKKSYDLRLSIHHWSALL